jgi:hypothetical protein
MRKSTAAIVSILMLLMGIFIGWATREEAAYDNCLDRINYDKAFWHLCDNREPRANT